MENGSDGLVVTGTTGESPTLSDDERFALYEAAVDEVGDRATVVAGTGTNSTEHSVHLTERAHEVGVDGLLIITPYYNKPPVRGIVEHFKAIAEVSDKPIVVYNIPARVVLNLEPEAIAQLAEIPSVKAVKQANADIEQARRIVDLGLDLYAGDDDIVFPFLEVGGVGGICVHTHVVGPQVKEMVRRFRSGDVDGARALDEELRPSIDLLRVAPNPIAIKCALNLLGHDVGGLRLPLVEADEDEQAAVRGCLRRLGLLQPAARLVTRSRDLLAQLMGAQTEGVPGQLRTETRSRHSGRLRSAARTDLGCTRIGARPRAARRRLVFVALDDGTLVVDEDLPDGSLAPLADAIEAIDPRALPCRGAPERRRRVVGGRGEGLDRRAAGLRGRRRSS